MWMNPMVIKNSAKVMAMIKFEGGPTGYIQVDRLSNTTDTYSYMPCRNLPHLQLGRAIQEHGQAEVVIHLKSGFVSMLATAMSARTITLAMRADDKR